MKPTFRSLADNYPYPPDQFPCKLKDGSPAFENQCAIRMGVALNGAGALTGYSGARCWHGHSGHTLRAEELANWLRAPGRFGAPSIFRGKAPKAGQDALKAIRTKNGVLFLKDFWGPGNSGDHIDLWEAGSMRTGSLDYFNFAPGVWFWELL